MLIPLSSTELDTILEWRNQSEVRLYSFNDQLISKQEHYRWWQDIKNDLSKRWMIYVLEGQNAGVVNYYNIKYQEEAFWGFYFSDKFEGYEKLKLWFKLEKEAISYAFETLKLLKLKCEVFRDNKAALIMHKRIGYQEIDTYQHDKGEVIVLEIQKSRVKKNG